MSFKKFIREYFTLNKRETKGAVILVSILLVLAAINQYVRLQPDEPIELTEEEQAKVREIESRVKKVSKEAKDEPAEIEEESSESIEWFPFDPNLIAKSELIRLGLNEKIASRLVNYRSKGGQFRKSVDLLKIYGMDTNWVLSASAFMEIEKEVQSPNESERENIPSKAFKKLVRVIELNSADSATLDSIPGVGPFYCKHIIKYRNSLGGFSSFDQLSEVYRMRDETMDKMKEHIRVDASQIQKINLNECSEKELAAHPYISWKQAKIICAWRDQHGGYSSLPMIKETEVISDSIFNRITPYLAIE